MKPRFFSLVQSELNDVEDRMRGTTTGEYPDLQAALNHVVSSGGKRVRPTVALLIGRMLDGDAHRIVTLAAAVELLHTATLVHDDLIDGAILRRGNPTLNTRWSPAATVLAGDYFFACAAELAAATESVAVVKIFSRALSTIVGGEVNQLFKSRGLVSREDYFQRIYAKTASLFEAAAHMATILSSEDPDEIEALKQYGYQIGMAFQIVDDILDFTGEQATVGKPVGSDLRQGLFTLPAIHYLESHPDDPDLQAVLKGAYTEEQINRVVNAIRTGEEVKKAMDEAREFVHRSLESLATMPGGEEQQALAELANYIIDREI